ncbi:hypothetical protein [Georgenia sp. AZ-5]
MTHGSGLALLGSMVARLRGEKSSRRLFLAGIALAVFGAWRPC